MAQSSRATARMNAKPTVHATLWQRSERNYRIAEKLPLPLGEGWGEGLRPAEYLDILSFFGYSCPLPNLSQRERGRSQQPATSAQGRSPRLHSQEGWLARATRESFLRPRQCA